jgi:hypothetical protein
MALCPSRAHGFLFLNILSVLDRGYKNLDGLLDWS